jgi:hypothetical protein
MWQTKLIDRKKESIMAFEYVEDYYDLFDEIRNFFYRTNNNKGKALADRISLASREAMASSFEIGLAKSLGKICRSQESPAGKPEFTDEFIDSWQKTRELILASGSRSLRQRISRLDLEDAETIKNLIFSINKGEFKNRQL